MKLIIEQDQTPMNPRADFDQVISLAMFHKRYSLPNDSKLSHGDYNSWEELENAIKRNCDTYYVVPVYMYDHGGTCYSTSPFSCNWDSGRIGFAYITRKVLQEEFGWKRITKARSERIDKMIQTTLEEYEQYANGEVYGFIVEDDDGNEVDSCWGFFGGDHNKSGIKDHIDESLKYLVDEIGYGAGEAETKPKLGKVAA